MTKPAKIALVAVFLLGALIVVIMERDQQSVIEAGKLRTEAQIEIFARQHGTEVGCVRQHMVYTYIVRVGYPVPDFIAREFHWGDEVPGGFESRVTIFNKW
jgi:hypothetical protein